MSRCKTGFFPGGLRAIIVCVSMVAAYPGHAQLPQKNAAAITAVQAPDLDLSIIHYTRVQTPEGVLRESRYEEKMIRRAGHVWTERVVPKSALIRQAIHPHDKAGPAASAGVKEHAHRHFNPVLLPRHVSNTGGQLRLEFVDFHEREVISIAPSEYENVNFDGSWINTFFLVDPKIVAALPASKKTAPSGARWHESSRDGMYQRVLWDEKRLIPLLVEKGDIEGNILERMEVRVQPESAALPRWTSLKGYAQKEYADFLD